MEKFGIESCGAYCIIDTDQNIKEFLLNNKNTIEIPNFKILDNIDDINYKIIYRNCLPGDEFITCDENKILIKYPKNKLSDSNIAYITKYLLEKQYAKLNRATCHSSCISKDNNAILILGGSGAGKTSVAIDLCCNYGYRLISNDQTVIGVENDNLYAYGGTKFINFRYSSLIENMPYLKEYVFKEEPKDPWNYKSTVFAEDIGISCEYDKNLINTITVLHLDNRRDKIEIYNGNNWKNNFLLYQTLSENIRNSLSTIVDKNGIPIGYVPSYDNEEYFNKRCKIISLINNHKNYINIVGSLPSVSKYLNNINSTSCKNKKLVKEK